MAMDGKDAAAGTLAVEGVLGTALRVRGAVQGVGFRPFVYRLATQMGLAGSVHNGGDHVAIHLAAEGAVLERFCRRLVAEAPPHARIQALEQAPWHFEEAPSAFVVAPSQGWAAGALPPPDLACCPACLAELEASGDRRQGYPFINCSHCGPRYSLVAAMPYQRGATGMKAFALCPACESQYQDVLDRRFHAEPIACPSCGPRLWLQGPQGRIEGEPQALLAQCCLWLAQGKVLAIKGIGGFQLAVDARAPEAIARLRGRKQRPAKPLAVMVKDIDEARRYFTLSAEQIQLLQSRAAPIVLLPKVAALAPLPELLAPGQVHIGLMLAYSPLHWLLLAAFDGPLVMTSGNAKGAPLCTGNDQALADLAGLADAFLLHDRPILRRCDDSVLALEAGRPRLIRRARGYVPETLEMPGLEGAVLALGGDLKNAFCLTQGGQGLLSVHQGDLSHPQCLSALEEEIKALSALWGFKPRCIAVDAHPDYFSSRLGRRLAKDAGLPLVAVQHHHAHLAACLVENGRQGPALGIILDGLGYGDDGSLWGGELLLADLKGYRRLGRLKPFPLLGGDKANRQPWRNLLAQLDQAACLEAGQALVPALASLDAQALLKVAPKAMSTSSMGRLFDAVAALLGLAPLELSFEGEAAMKLEAQALSGREERCYPFDIAPVDGLWQLDPAPFWRSLLADLNAGLDRATAALGFHLGLAQSLAALVAKLRDEADFTAVALSGGVFQNALLAAELEQRLKGQGLEVLRHGLVPCNDGGLALGQAAVALACRGGA
ncbi:carbamoyltransferase HypF [Gallaecimonas kandeliae]|uniref:carbamoyltransferase HypF n=1 Tax=Gallaecimonas kandeliae TaxID=3029055 RepID=UPI0026490D84|nr:carbamoyltransferase HypF [Gallaecimonas kandeliae]WKE64223.1 carbamoyltransferase HypF [Gallaecimonas kandeliae]